MSANYFEWFKDEESDAPIDVVTLAAFYGIIIKHTRDLNFCLISFAGKTRKYQETHFGHVYLAVQKFLKDTNPTVFGKAMLTPPALAGFTLEHMKRGITCISDNVFSSISISAKKALKEIPDKDFATLVADMTAVDNGSDPLALHGKYHVPGGWEKHFCGIISDQGILYGDYFTVGLVLDFDWIKGLPKYEQLQEAEEVQEEEAVAETPAPVVPPVAPVTVDPTPTVNPTAATSVAASPAKDEKGYSDEACEQVFGHAQDSYLLFKDISTLYKMGMGVVPGLDQKVRKAAREFNQRTRTLQRSYGPDAWMALKNSFPECRELGPSFMKKLLPKLALFKEEDKSDIVAYAFLKFKKFSIEGNQVVVTR